jgi:hypothetical protein
MIKESDEYDVRYRAALSHLHADDRQFKQLLIVQMRVFDRCT